ncbi:MAG TPA: FAD-dependent oxidoreductase [Papillibacter sp.]|nr:FAD-dependent oxidoreductase [Papillibacter sp.]
MGKHIVIAGAGYAGVYTAKKLQKRLKKEPDVSITLIDKNPYHTMLTELHEVAANRVQEDHVRFHLEDIFAGRKVNLRMDTVTGVDFENKTLRCENGDVPYDYLVIALGSTPTYFGTPGAKEHTFGLWSYEDALKIRHHIEDVFRRAVSETDEAKRKGLLTFFVVGAGFTGVEMVGELAEWIDELCEKFHVPRQEVRLVNADLLERVVPMFPEKVGAKADRRLRKMGVELMLKTKVKAVGDGYIELEQGERTFREETDTVIWTAGIESAEALEGMSLEKQGRGRIKTDDYLRAEGREDVFIAGDNVFYIPEGMDAPVPQMVENAEQSAETVAHYIVSLVAGKGTLQKYAPKFHGAMLSVGSRYGCAYLGGKNRKISLASFFAMLTKHLIYIIYFIQILGWKGFFEYIRNEFFTIRRRRSILGGHFSNRTPSFLLVPLRVFLGAYWIFEGIKKIGEEWLQSPKLAQFFSSAEAVFDAAISGASTASGATALADATTSATQAAADVSLIFDWNILGIFRLTFIESGDYAIRLKFVLMDWFNSLFLLRTEGQQMFFQHVVVISEIVIGILLILGLFSFVASGYALFLQALFLMTTGLYLSQWWMIFAAFALLIGSGRIFGLDYYVLPAMKDGWRRNRLVKRLYLYHD